MKEKAWFEKKTHNTKKKKVVSEACERDKVLVKECDKISKRGCHCQEA